MKTIYEIRKDLHKIPEIGFNEFKTKNKDSEYQYSFIAPKTYKGANVEYCVLPYTYVKDDIKMSGEMYVASRAMAYYVIYVDRNKIITINHQISKLIW